MYFCKNCGRMAHPGEDRCPKCGATQIILNTQLDRNLTLAE